MAQHTREKQSRADSPENCFPLLPHYYFAGGAAEFSIFGGVNFGVSNAQSVEGLQGPFGVQSLSGGAGWGGGIDMLEGVDVVEGEDGIGLERILYCVVFAVD